VQWPEALTQEALAKAVCPTATEDAVQIASMLIEGQQVVLPAHGHYGTLLKVQSEIKRQVGMAKPLKTTQCENEAEVDLSMAGEELRLWRRTVQREACQNCLLPFSAKAGELQLRGNPGPNGFIQSFYNSSEDLYLRLNDFFALNLAWQYFVNGIKYPFLRHPLHTFLDVYCTPKPIEHFELLVDWLDRHSETLTSSGARALDLGTGCGVIACLLREKRPELAIVASDISANSVYSVSLELERWQYDNIEVVQSDLFENVPGQFDMITFNPPWIPAAREAADGTISVLSGNFYPSELFERLFHEAPGALRPGGQLVIIFSNYAERRGLVQQSPLAAFAEGDGPLVLEAVERRCIDAPLARRNRKTRQEKAWAIRDDYEVELWIFRMQG